MIKLFDNIIGEMFVILIRLPYLSLLQESLKNKASLKTNQQTFAPFPFAPQWRPSVRLRLRAVLNFFRFEIGA
jgi:hypothetical protein